MTRRPRAALRRWLAGSVLAGMPLPAFALAPGVPPWAAYAFFAIVAMVVIVLLLHEALDDDGRVEISREKPEALPLAERAANRYARRHDSENDAAIRRIA